MNSCTFIHEYVLKYHLHLRQFQFAGMLRSDEVSNLLINYSAGMSEYV